MLRTRSLSPSLAPRTSSVVERARRLSGLASSERILGVDPGLHRTGYGLISCSDSGVPKLLEGGVLRAKANDPFPKRLQDLHNGLSEVLAEHKPDIVVVEDLFSTYAHPRSALLMAHARGVLLLAAQEANITVHSFTPNEVKQVVAGNGHAPKSSIQAAVKARLQITATLHPPDLADALAIALCFAMRRDMGQKLV